MYVILSPLKSDGESSYLRLLKSFQSLENSLESILMNTMVYDQKFVKNWMRLLNELYPNLCLIGNTFLQQSTLEELILSKEIELYVYSTSDTIEKYQTGGIYESLYKTLKKSCKSGVYLNEDPDDNHIQSITTQDLLKITLILWRETHMGEITDAITRALQGIESTVEPDEVKQAMSNLGMNIEGYEPQNPDEVAEEAGTPEGNSEPFMNPPEPDTQEEDQMCCKISGNNIVLMFPKDTQFNVVEIGGIEFNTLTVSLPDISSGKLQVLDIIHQSEDTAPQTTDNKPKVVRVPIFLPKNDSKPKKESKKAEVSNSNLDSLRQQKSELDAKIKQARSNNDSGLVEQLRKERRKLRAEINKLGGGE